MYIGFVLAAKREGRSIADEVVGADGPAQIRPTLRAPVVDQAGTARDVLETLRLAHGGKRGMPEKRTGDHVTGGDITLRVLKSAHRSSHVKVDEFQTSQ